MSVWCGPWEEGVVATPSFQVLFRGPSAADPRWHLRAVAADVKLGQPMTFPNGFVFDQPKDVDVFVFDPPNALSTQGWQVEWIGDVPRATVRGRGRSSLLHRRRYRERVRRRPVCPRVWQLQRPDRSAAELERSTPSCIRRSGQERPIQITNTRRPKQSLGR